MNILILGTGNIEQALISLCKKSKYLDHIYTASKKPLDKIANIEYHDYKDLIKKAKALHIDLVLIANKILIQEGLVEILKKNKINTIAVNQKWLNLENSRIIAKKLLSYYHINTPEIIRAPKTFPVVIKTNKPNLTKIAYTMDELIKYREEINDDQVFIEEFLDGKVQYLLSLWDGKNIFHFKLDFTPTEVQKDRLDLYKTKLSIMLSEEKPDFIGFFITKLLWAKNDWYILEYIMHLDNNYNLNLIEQDFLYILNAAIYQKLNEVEIKYHTNS